MKSRRPPIRTAIIVQLVVFAAFAIGIAATPNGVKRSLQDALAGDRPKSIPIPRKAALRIAPLYDDPTVVSDDDLAMVLRKIRPKFPRKALRPNHVEHALRMWGIDATFDDRDVLSGRELLDVLINHGKYAAAWDAETDPLLSHENDGVAVRWGPHDASGSVHHDHLLASLSEAGVPINEKVYPPGDTPATFGTLLQQALRDFRLDEKETEWSAMAFALWLPPETTSWKNSAGRRIDFNLLAERLMRGHAKYGVCSGTHRIYSLVVLWRIDQRSGLFTAATRAKVRSYLQRMRDLIVASQFADGHWASNWSSGKTSLDEPIAEPAYKAVIATGHHLEWLAIAPDEFHPPREVVRNAAHWLVRTVRSKSEDEILARYTFYSHVGNALALWRKTRPAEFRRQRTKP